MQYSYNDGGLYYFMDQETFEMLPINESQIGDALKFVRENDFVRILSHNGSVFGIEPPNFVELKVTDTEPGLAGNTAQGATKPATLETGATVYVPLFINIGDVLRIDTRTSTYIERA